MDIEIKGLIEEVVKRLKGYQRREYIAQISLDYFQGSARKTERKWDGEGNALKKG